MELLCARLIRSRRSLFCPLSTQLTRSLLGNKAGGYALKTRLISSSKELQRKSCQRTASLVQLNSSNRLCGGRLLSDKYSGTVFFPQSPRSPVLTQCGSRSPVLTQCGYQFHTSGPLRAIPVPLIWLVLKPLQKLLAVILGRSIRKWWADLPPNKRQLLREAAWRRRWHLAAAGSLFLLIIALFCLTHLDESPVTGRTRLLVFSRENYMELAGLTSKAYMVEYEERLLPESDPRHQVVERLVRHLSERNKEIPEVASVPWSVHVVQEPTRNAFVLPDGKVFVFTGMLDAVADVHQLAILLGHEMAHAIMGHAAEQASLSHMVDFLSLILLTAIWAVCPRDSLAVLGHWIQNKLVELMFSRPYSRKLESEADQVGLQLAAKACADVRAGPVFWQQIELTDQLSGEPTIPEWLSTHPSHRNRVTQLDRLVPQALELRESCDCPALPATDPRAVFSKSVRLLLESAKAGHEREGGDKGSTVNDARPGVLAAALLLARPPAAAPVAASAAPVVDTAAAPRALVSPGLVVVPPAEGGQAAASLDAQPCLTVVLDPPEASSC